MRQRVTIAHILFLAVLFVSGCAGPGRQSQEVPVSVHHEASLARASYVPSIYNLAQGLSAQLRRNCRSGDLSSFRCIVTTFVDIDDLSRSSTFGRLLAEAMGAEIFMQGGRVVDVRQARSLLTKPGTGELILTREAEELAREMDADTVLAGTYGVGPATVAVTVRLMDLKSHEVLSVARTEIARTPSVNELLSDYVYPRATACDRLPALYSGR